jgi:hypothetical protein
MTEHTYTIPGFKVMLEGESGSGKTHALSTLIDAGITPMIVFTEKGMTTLGKLNIPEDKCHWQYLSPTTQDWEAMAKMGSNINKMSYDALTKIADPNKGKYDQFLKVLRACNDFKCDRTGETFGDASSWGTDRALVFDSLSGLSSMSMNLVVGAKPTKAMPDWMVAMDNLERFLLKVTQDLNCHVIITSHLEREQDEVTGGITLMPSTLGRKLPPKLAPMFDEVIHTVRNGSEFAWSTASRNVVTKTRLLDISDQLQPSFIPLTEAWKKAGGVIVPTSVQSDAVVASA